MNDAMKIRAGDVVLVTVEKDRFTNCEEEHRTAWARGSDGKMPEATWFHRAKARAVAMTKVKT